MEKLSEKDIERIKKTKYKLVKDAQIVRKDEQGVYTESCSEQEGVNRA